MMQNKKLSKKSYLIARVTKPKRCKKCRKVIRIQNESGLCYGCDVRIRMEKNNVKVRMKKKNNPNKKGRSVRRLK